MEKQLPSQVKRLLLMEPVNGMTPSCMQFGFLKMKCHKNFRSASARLLFPWYGHCQHVFPPHSLAYQISIPLLFRWLTNNISPVTGINKNCCSWGSVPKSDELSQFIRLHWHLFAIGQVQFWHSFTGRFHLAVLVLPPRTSDGLLDPIWSSNLTMALVHLVILLGPWSD